MYDEDKINESILNNNLKRNYPDLGPRERQEALQIAKIAFRGNITNGEAARIGAECVKAKR